jgi:small subunit ribosomal protein S27Ae
MKYIVRAVDEVLEVDLDSSSDVNDLKLAIEDVGFVPCHLQRLQIGNRLIDSGLLIDQISEDDELELVLELNGGMRAKWRKKRMRRLRRIRRKRRARAK